MSYVADPRFAEALYLPVRILDSDDVDAAVTGSRA